MNDRVMEIFQFTERDLEYNRKGVLSPTQQVRVSASRRKLKRGIFVLGVVLIIIAAGWMWIFARSGESGAMVAVVVGAVLFGLPGLIALLSAVKPASKITIQMVRGPAKIARVEHTSTSNTGTRRFVKTEIHIADQVIVVPDAAFTELADGATYAVYRWKDVGEIFSLEQV